MKIRRHFVSALIGIVFFTVCERNTEKRKIKLADQNTITHTDEQITTTIHLEPTMRRAIAVLFFENKTGDQNLEWLKKGLTEMIIRSLSQSHFDNDIFPVSLQPGLNKILIKVCNRVGEWGYYFRITDANGNGIADIQFVSPDQVENRR